MPTDLQDDLVDQAADTIRAHLRDFVRRLRDAGWVDPQEAVALHGKGYREAIDELRAEAERTAHLTGWQCMDRAAELLESRTSPPEGTETGA